MGGAVGTAVGAAVGSAVGTAVGGDVALLTHPALVHPDGYGVPLDPAGTLAREGFLDGVAMAAMTISTTRAATPVTDHHFQERRGFHQEVLDFWAETGDC